jgi:hypothetical protein
MDATDATQIKTKIMQSIILKTKGSTGGDSSYYGGGVVSSFSWFSTCFSSTRYFTCVSSSCSSGLVAIKFKIFSFKYLKIRLYQFSIKKLFIKK